MIHRRRPRSSAAAYLGAAAALACLCCVCCCIASRAFGGRGKAGAPQGGGGPALPSPAAGAQTQGCPAPAPGASARWLSARAVQDHAMSNGVLELSLRRWHAGAVSTLSCRGRTVVPMIAGRGGSLQSACCFDVTNCEDFNPTEAGAEADHGRPASSSKWTALSTSGTTEAYTMNRMAYYYVKGATISTSGAGPHASLADGVLSKIVHSKRVSLNWKGNRNLVNFEITFRVPKGTYSYAQFQALAAFVTTDLSVSRQWDARTKAWVPAGPPAPNVAACLSTPDGSLAIAMLCYRCTAGTGGIVNFAALQPGLNMLTSAGIYGAHGGPKLDAGAYNFSVAVAVGTLAECAAAIRLVAR